MVKLEVEGKTTSISITDRHYFSQQQSVGFRI
jgi:hypothetical protein